MECFCHFLTDNTKRASIQTTRLAASLPPIGMADPGIVTVNVVKCIL